MSPVEQLTADRPLVPALALARPRARALVVVAVLVLAALTFLAPSAPTYDPWAWIVWGREVLHLDLSTVDGPSWKPLPVLLTTPFALTGSLAPDLWLYVARVGALAGVVVVFGLVRRLGGGVVGASAAAAAYAAAPWTIRNAALGNSEGLLVALALGAVDRHLAGRRGQAFALGVGAALLRPEAWPFLGLYGVVLLWREPGLRRLVAGGFVLLPVLWLLPELWGSGDLLRAMHRAQTPRADSAAFAQDPARAVLEQFTSLLTPAAWLGIAALVAVLALGLVRRRARPTAAELRAAAGLALGAVTWVALVAYMTSDGGFSGNTRYLILPATLALVLAGTGVGWALRAVAPRAAVGAAAVGLAVVAAGLFALPSRARLEPTLHSVAYQARLTDELGPAVSRAGGKERLLACGTPYTGPFQVPSVAWQLDVHTHDVRLAPAAPAVVFRARTTSRAPAARACAVSAGRTGSGRSPPRRGGASSGPAG